MYTGNFHKYLDLVVLNIEMSIFRHKQLKDQLIRNLALI